MWIEEQNPEPEVPMQLMKLQLCTVVRQGDVLSQYVEGVEAVQQDAMEKLDRELELQVLYPHPPSWPTFFGAAR